MTSTLTIGSTQRFVKKASNIDFIDYIRSRSTTLQLLTHMERSHPPHNVSTWSTLRTQPDTELAAIQPISLKVKTLLRMADVDSRRLPCDSRHASANQPRAECHSDDMVAAHPASRTGPDRSSQHGNHAGGVLRQLVSRPGT